MWGEYCCKYAEEDQSAVSFGGCDGSSLSLSSLCCKNSEYQKCSGTGGCQNYMGTTTNVAYILTVLLNVNKKCFINILMASIVYFLYFMQAAMIHFQVIINVHGHVRNGLV